MKNALCLGTFDGVHKGHKKVLARAKDYRTTAVTFRIPPKAILGGECELLMSLEDRCSVLKNLGVSEICILDFNDVRDEEPSSFLEKLYKQYSPSLICCGFNYRFGKDGKGETQLLREFCLKNSIELSVCEPVVEEGELISSSRIRGLIKTAKFSEAEGLLGRPFSFEAEVIHGAKRGRTIGFPTANQQYPEGLVKLKNGVYKTKIIIDGKEFDGITDIGKRPTFETKKVMCETYIKDFSADIYGKKVRIIPLKFLREERKFSSLEELKKQIEKDIKEF